MASLYSRDLDKWADEFGVYSLQIIVLLLKREQNTNANPMSNFLVSSNFECSRPNTMICFHESPVSLKHLL